jgi:hypothetical protein
MPRPNTDALTEKRLAQAADIARAARKYNLPAIEVALTPEAAAFSVEGDPSRSHAILCKQWLRVVKLCVGRHHAIAWVRTVEPRDFGLRAAPVWRGVVWTTAVDFVTDAIRTAFHDSASIKFTPVDDPKQAAVALVVAIQTMDEKPRKWAKQYHIRRFQVGGKATLGLMPHHTAQALPTESPQGATPTRNTGTG